MPTVLIIGGWRVVIYPNDHRPAHVHVIGGGCEAVFNLSEDGPELRGVTSENGKNRTVSRWHGLASRKRSFLRGFNENQIRASAGMACCFLENHSHIARLKQPSFENHENAVSRGWQLAQSRAVAGYRIS